MTSYEEIDMEEYKLTCANPETGDIFSEVFTKMELDNGTVRKWEEKYHTRGYDTDLFNNTTGHHIMSRKGK
jgi:hypothetical protein